MNRPRFVRVTATSVPLRAGTTIPGLRREGDYIPPGKILPIEWFNDTPDEVFEWFITPVGEFTSAAEPGVGFIEAYEPGTAEMALLRNEFPLLFAPKVEEAPAPVVVPQSKKHKPTSEATEEVG